MSWIHALLLGILEGLTEFLPVSSTGHLILYKRAAGLSGDGVDSFLVVVQLGALLAVVLHYRTRWVGLLQGCVRRDKEALAFTARLVVASVPLLGLGYAGHHWIKTHLFSDATVAVALVAGGVVLAAVDAVADRWSQRHVLSRLSWWRVACVGLCQAASLLPGTSRSMSTLVGGRLVGLSRMEAADFAFLLALPTLGSATLYELVHARHQLFAQVPLPSFAIGLVTSFVVGWFVVRVFLRWLGTVGLWPFALYRILLGAAVLLLRRM